jgi:hypothetical protein
VPCVVAVQLFDKLEQLKKYMETKEEKRKNLVEFLFENSTCLNCIVVYYCGSFISKEDCLKCIDNGLQELLQHNVSNRREQLIAFCEFYKNSKYLFEKWTAEEIVGLYLKSN